MREILVACDGARPTKELLDRDWFRQISLSHRGASANVNLSIETPSHRLLTGVSDRSADLIRIAAYAYAADQAISRGGEADVYGKDWRRSFVLSLPVSDLAFWSAGPTREQLQSVLHFASEDYWEFHFAQAEPAISQLTFDLNPNETLGRPDSAYLFSGGLDSLCAVVEAMPSGARPLLIGHSPAFHIATRQREVLALLREKITSWHFPYLSVSIHRRGKKDPKEYTQRTRAFLYAAIGTVIADRLGFREVNIPDNGVVSLNLPINEQLVGAKASRSTHPKFLRLFTRLSALIYEREVRLLNSLWARTRAEVLGELKAAGLEELLEATNSCSHPRNLPKLQAHCGICTQCIDRRFATLATGLEEYDPGERYRLDIFRQALPEGVARTMVLSYVRFGQRVAALSGEVLFGEYPQLYDCIDAEQTNQRETAEALTGMIQRHGQTVVRVLKEQFERYSEDLAGSRLPEACLLRIVSAPEARFDQGAESESEATVGGGGTGDSRPRVRYSPDFSTVTVNGKTWHFVGTQARAIGVFMKQWEAGVPELNQQYVLTEAESEASRLRDLFKNSPAWGTLLVRCTRAGFYRLDLD